MSSTTKKSIVSSLSRDTPERMRNVSVVVNNPSEKDLKNLESLNYKYMIIGKEQRKTPHLQCYIQFQNAMTFNGLKKKLPGAHIEHAITSPEKNIEYCKKEGDYKEYGKVKVPGKRTDLDEIRTLALESGMRAVTRIGTQAQVQVAQQFLTYNETPRKCKPNVFWIYGPPGVGKGRLADSILKRTTGESDVFVITPLPSDEVYEPYEKSDPTKWWNGYDAHSNVIIDDFRHSWWPLTYLLKLLDRRAFQVENKGGMRQFKAKNIIITSIFPPHESYINASKKHKYYSTIEEMMKSRKKIDDKDKTYDTEDLVDSIQFDKKEPSEQLLRRIDEIIELEYTFNDNDEYIEHQAKYTNYKLKGTHHLCGRTLTSGIVKFDIDNETVASEED